MAHHHPLLSRIFDSTEEEAIMRIYEGDFAYEVERIVSPETQLTKGWRYNVYRVRPGNELLRSGEALTKEAAEQAGRELLEEIMRGEHGRGGGKTSAA
jgi:hypothetical protein